MGILDAPRRRSVAIGVLGQSNEHGAVAAADKANYPQAFGSLRRRSVRAPLGPAIQPYGGFLFKVHDDLYDAGWDPVVLNGAVGSMSFVTNGAGVIGGWAANNIYYRKRASSGPADRGYAGDLIQVGGGVWRCVAGNDRIALNTGPDLTGAPGYGDGYLDNVTVQPGVRAAGAAFRITITGSPTGGTYALSANGGPTAAIAYNATAAAVQSALRARGGAFATAAVGGAAGGPYVVTLNPATSDQAPLALVTNSLTGGATPAVSVVALTFANYTSGPTNPLPSDPTGTARGAQIAETPSSSSNAGVIWEFQGFASSTPGNGNGTVGAWPVSAGVLDDFHAGMGFDPLGLLHRLHEEMQRQNADRKIIYLANGQSDIGFASTTANTVSVLYRDALVSIANFFLNRGYEVVVGFTNYSPGATGTTTQWDNLVASVAAAISTLQAGSNGSRVFTGANLYSLMGTSGPMATGGAFLNGDGVHMNGRACVGPALSGVQPAGKLVADAIKAALAA